MNCLRRSVERVVSVALGMYKEDNMHTYDEFIMALGATDDEEVKKRNRELCERYPFLRYHSQFGNKDLDGYDYDFIYLDDMPEGWTDAFGVQMCEELRDILIEGDFLDKYQVVQVKEKYGRLCWYDCGVPEKIWDKYTAWLNKYENLSKKTCVACGKPGKMVYNYWISPWCEDCFHKLHGKDKNYEEWCSPSLS